MICGAMVCNMVLGPGGDGMHIIQVLQEVPTQEIHLSRSVCKLRWKDNFKAAFIVILIIFS